MPHAVARPGLRNAIPIFVPILALLALAGAVPVVGLAAHAPVPNETTLTGTAASGHGPTVSIVGGPTVFPPNRPVGVAPLARETNISPNDSYTSEPAPMGIADVGLTPSGAAYSYYTPVFVGNATVHSLETSSTGSGTRYMCFQLNVEVVLQNGSNRVSYWIQDVSSVDSAARTIGYLDNVWNFSAGNGFMDAQSVAGNGTVNNVSAGSGYEDWYSDGAGTYPGNGVTLTWPANISNKVVASTIAGMPHVSFEYNDGFGWVTYDNVSFPFAQGWTNLGFYVTGTQYVPLTPGLVYDAEWDFTGSGSGQQNVNSSLDMALDYWNGHNYQAVRSAFNHGFNTGESLSNVVTSYATDASNGIPYSHNGNGPGNLEPLYGPSNVSDLGVVMPASSGTLFANGAATPYIGGAANLTLAPGTYWLAYYLDGALNASTNVTLTGGESLTVVLSPISHYAVTLSETGLPSGTVWNATIGLASYSTSSPVITTSLPNGTYPFTVSGVPGYSLGAYQGTISVAGAPAGKTFYWTQVVFPVRFVAFNLPPGATWTVTVDGQTVSAGTATAATASLPNGTWDYSVTASTGAVPSPATGSVTVTGGPTSADVSFTIGNGWLFGSVSPTTASVLVNGGSVTTHAGAFNVSLSPGAYEVEFELSGYGTEFRNITITAGIGTSLSISLSPQSAGGTTTTPAGSSGLTSTDTLWLGIGAVVAVVVVVAAVLLIRRPPATGSP